MFSKDQKTVKALESPILCNLALVAVVIIMISASEFFGDKEIIFPEVAALAIGCFISPVLPWKTSYIRMVICITLCAVSGVIIVLFVPGPLYIRFSLGFLIGQLFMLFSGTSLAPMISAICLPILVSTTSPVYIVAACLLTLLLVILRIIMEKTCLKTPNVYTVLKYDLKSQSIMVLTRTVIILILSSVLFRFDLRFAVAPPLLVAFTELTNPECPAGRNRLKTTALVCLCGLSGALSRYLIVNILGQSIILAAVLLSVILIFLLHIFNMSFPPAGAIAVLPLLIPDGYLLYYPFHIIIGFSALVVLSIPLSHINTAVSHVK